MRDSIYNAMQAIAENNELNLVETTSERNGYPRNLGYAIEGFGCWCELEDVVSELENELSKEGVDAHVEIIEINRDNGWRLWHRGSFVCDPYDLESKFQDDSNIFDNTIDEEDFIKNEILECIDGVKDVTLLQDIVQRKTELWNAITDLDDLEMIVEKNGCFEVMLKYAMSFSYDTHNYSIAVQVIED